MSARRVLAAVAVIVIAALSAPAAAAPGVNSADLICILAPFALLTVCVVRRSHAPVEAPESLPQGVPSRGLDGSEQEGWD